MQLCSGIFGRGTELARLQDLLDRAGSGHGGVVFVVGEAGIGKSRLAREIAADAAAQDWAVLTGRAVDSTTPTAFRPLAEAMAAHVRAAAEPPDAELARFARAGAPVVALAEAVMRFLRAAAGRAGALLVLEDLHWADPETLAILEYLADNLAAERVLCIGSVRDDDSYPALRLARALQARRVADIVPVPRLGPADLAAMVGSCLGTGAVAAELLAVAERAEGVPFLVEELLADALATGADGSAVPVTFAESVRNRLGRLGPTSSAVVSAAAVLGREFSWDLLPGMANVDPAGVSAALRDAIGAQLVELDAEGSAFRFRHALTRDAVLADLLPPERTELARRALSALDAGEEAAERRELAASMAELAGAGRRAVELLLDVGREAATRGALATAEAALRRATGVAAARGPLLADVEEQLVAVLSLAGRHAEAAGVGERLLRRLGPPGAGGDIAAARRRAEVNVRLSGAAVAASGWVEARARVAAARLDVALLRGDPSGALQAEFLTARADSIAAQAALGEDDAERAKPLAQQALTAAERLGLPEVACESLEVLGRAERWRNLAAAEEAFRRGLAVAEAHDLGVWRLRALYELGTIDMLECGGIARLEEAHGLATQSGALATAAEIEAQIGAVLACRDDPLPALEVTRRSAAVARRLGLGAVLAVALGFEATAQARTGDEAEMERLLAAARDAMPAGVGAGDLEVLAVGARVFLAYTRDDTAGALRLLDDSAEARRSAPFGGPWALLRAVLAGDDAATAEVAGRGDPVEFFGRAYLRYAEGVGHGRAGRGAEAEAAFAAGDRLLADFAWFRHYGRRLVAQAAIEGAWGDPVGPLREARDFYAARGDRAVASACGSLLRRAGAPVRRKGRGSLEVPAVLRELGVTAREAEVLALVAAGLTNRDIAERLFLSPRTVETHVERLLVKTGVANRRALARTGA